MSHFSIMLVPDAGQTKTYRLSKGKLYALVAAAFLFLTFGSIGIYGLLSSYEIRKELALAQNLIQKERQQYARLHADFEAKIKAEEDKMAVYARSLGQMQARLSRLDALGKRLVESTPALAKSEFNFDVQPAFGGPRIAEDNSAQVDIQLFDQIKSIDAQIASLDTQLMAVDYILKDGMDEKNARPHTWPSEGGWLSSHFGMRTDPFTGNKAMHRGIDIANRFGAPVLAASRGIVIYAGKMKDYGYLVEIEHGYGYRTRYGHMSAVTVTVGDVVEANQMIGRVGSSGRSTGPHLHYEVRRSGQLLNPEKFIPRT